MFDLIIDGEIRQIEIAQETQQNLHDQVIDEDQPGTVLRDFESLLAFVGTDGLKTTGKYHFLPQGKLNALNDRMTLPVAHRLKRPQQRSFPHLHGLYMLLRASGLGVSVGMSSSGRLVVDEQMLAAWYDLNPTERYFTLLESWLVLGGPEILAERSGWSSGGMYTLNWVTQKLKDRKTLLAHKRRGNLLCGTMEQVTVALMQLFGWLSLQYDQPQEGEGVKFAAVERLDFGDAMLAVLNTNHLVDLFSGSYDERAAQRGDLQPLFQPFFPQWQRLLIPPETPFRAGTYTWRVSLGQAWRRIRAPADLSLDDLALTILDAFDFDDEHLYCFQLRDNHGRNLRIACPYEEDAGASTDEVKLGDVPLPEGGVMTFHFDYGHDWKFNVKLEQVGASDAGLKRPGVTAEGGKAPAQYDWFEDE